MVAGGDTFTVQLYGRFLSEIGILEPSPCATINIDSTQYNGVKDLPVITRLKSGSHNVYGYANIEPLRSKYYFDHWEWDKSNNNVVPASETDEATTITVNGNGHLTAVFVKFSVTLSFPTDKTLKPSSIVGTGSDTMNFEMEIKTHGGSKRTTLYARIMVNGPPGALNLGLNSEPTMFGDSGIQPFTLGSDTPFSYTFGPITENSIPGMYYVLACVYDRPARIGDIGRCLSVISSFFTVDVGRSYIEVEGPTTNRIIHVHYAQEDVARGAHATVRDMLRKLDTANLIMNAADIANTIGSGKEAKEIFIQVCANLLIFEKGLIEWLDEDAKINPDGSYDFTIMQVIGDRGKFYQCAPNNVLSEIKEEVGWALFGAALSIAAMAATGGLLTPVAGPVLVICLTKIGLNALEYLMPIGEEWLDIGSPGYGRLVPVIQTSSIAEKSQLKDTTLTIPIQALEQDEEVYIPKTLPVNALTPANTETSTEILSITPSQILQVEPGAIIDFTITYYIYQEFSDNEVNQLILFCDSSGWPPQDGNYYQIYSGIPSRSGTLGTAEIQITVPNKPGHYYYWFGFNIGDDLERAADQFRGSFIPSLPHLRIDARAQFQLTVQVSGSGTTDPSPGTHAYDEGEEVSVDAIPDEGWMLDHWELDGVDVGSDPITVTMDADLTLTAIFTEIEYTLTVNTVGGGTVDQSPAPPYHLNDVVTLTASADPGWTFTGWSGDLTGSTNPDDITITGNMEVTAVFEVGAGNIIWTRVGNPSSDDDEAYGVAVDGTGVYVVGYDRKGGDRRWRMEKRDLATGSTIYWSRVGDPSSGHDEAWGVAVDGTGVYVVGCDKRGGDRRWRMEKRSLTTGSIIWSRVGDPSSGDDEAWGVAVDGTGVYVVGCDSRGGDARWRMEKRSLTTGSIIWSRVGDPSSGDDVAWGVAVDGTGVYVVGSDWRGGDRRWRMEKRSLTDGSIFWSRVGNPSSGIDQALGVAVDGTGVYVVGSDWRGGDRRWRMEKRSLGDGSLTWSRVGDPSSGDDEAWGVAVDGTGVYIVGYDSRGGDYRWRMEKRYP